MKSQFFRLCDIMFLVRPPGEIWHWLLLLGVKGLSSKADTTYRLVTGRLSGDERQIGRATNRWSRHGSNLCRDWPLAESSPTGEAPDVLVDSKHSWRCGQNPAAGPPNEEHRRDQNWELHSTQEQRLAETQANEWYTAAVDEEEEWPSQGAGGRRRRRRGLRASAGEGEKSYCEFGKKNRNKGSAGEYNHPAAGSTNPGSRERHLDCGRRGWSGNCYLGKWRREDKRSETLRKVCGDKLLEGMLKTGVWRICSLLQIPNPLLDL